MYFEEYFQRWKAQLPTPNFLKTVPVRFVIQDEATLPPPDPVHALGLFLLPWKLTRSHERT